MIRRYIGFCSNCIQNKSSVKILPFLLMFVLGTLFVDLVVNTKPETKISPKENTAPKVTFSSLDQYMANLGRGSPNMTFRELLTALRESHSKAAKWDWYTFDEAKLFEGKYDHGYEDARRKEFPGLILKYQRSFEKCINIYGDSHIMNFYTYIELLARKINATLILSMQSQAIPAKLMTGRVPLVPGYPKGIENCKNLLTFYSNYNNDITNNPVNSKEAHTNDTKTIIDFWSQRGHLVIIEDTPMGPTQQCLPSAFSELEVIRGIELKLNNATEEDRKFIIPRCGTPNSKHDINTFADLISENKWNFKNTNYMSINEIMCPYHEKTGNCSGNIGIIALYKDRHHLSTYFIQAIFPYLNEKLLGFPEIKKIFLENMQLP